MYQAHLPQYQALAHHNDFVFSLASNGFEIDQIVVEIVRDAANKGFNALRD